MNRFRIKAPSPSMVVALVALFIALSGVAVAGVTLSNNTVRSNNIVNGQVKNVDLATNSVGKLKVKNNAIDSQRIVDGSVSSGDVADGSVGNIDLAAGAVTPTKISGVPTVRAYNNAAVSVPSGAGFTAVPLNSERFDTASLHRTDVDTSRFTAPASGVYLVTGNVTWVNNSTGAREVNIRKNGSTLVARVVQPADPGLNTSDQSVTTLVQLAAGDFVELVVRQNSGGALNIASAPEHSPEFSAVWVAPL